jgi:hypothetical protein
LPSAFVTAFAISLAFPASGQTAQSVPTESRVPDGASAAHEGKTALTGQPKEVSGIKKHKELTGNRLTMVQTIEAPSEMATGFGRVQCDEDGNIYFDLDGAAMRKLSPKGERLALFQANANPDMPVIPTDRLWVGPDGEVYQLVFSTKEIGGYVFTYHSDGTFKSKIKLVPGFGWVPASYGVFSSGDLLVTGERFVRGDKEPRIPFTGIFSSDGTLRKQVNLEDDEKIRAMTESGDLRVTASFNPTSNRAISWSDMQAAKDGNIYFMLWLSPAIISAISPGGAIVKRFAIDPGDPAYTPSAFHISGHRIAVLFLEQPTMNKIIKVVDLNGKELATYNETKVEGKSGLGPVFACYTTSPERFTFLRSSDDYKLQFLVAEPH